jgi:hypothetical protein
VWDSSVGAWLAQGSTNNVGDQIAGLQAKFPVSVANGGTGASTVLAALDSFAIPIVQIVTATTSTLVENSTTTYADTTLTATISPRFSTSQILVLVTQNVNKTADSASNGIKLRLLRAGSQIATIANFLMSTGNLTEMSSTAAFQYLDSPGTTSAREYKTQIGNVVAANRVRAQYNGSSTITLMEVRI